MSNSGAERRHEYGRRASRKALASNGWRKKNPEYDQKENLLIYLTLKEVLMWDYGEDLISYTIAKRIRDGHMDPPKGWRKPDFESIKSRKALLSEEEARLEFEAQPDDPPPDFETSDKRFWTQTGKKKAYALIGVEPEESDDEGGGGGFFVPDHEPKLFSYVPLPFSDDVESEAGSEEDFHFEHHGDLTINSFDFTEQDDSEDEDASFAISEGVDEGHEELEWMSEQQTLKWRGKKQTVARVELLARSDRRARQTAAIGPQEAVLETEGPTVATLQEVQAQVGPIMQGWSHTPADGAGAGSVIPTLSGGAGADDDNGSRRRAPPKRPAARRQCRGGSRF
jgi:hypothetical protein